MYKELDQIDACRVMRQRVRELVGAAMARRAIMSLLPRAGLPLVMALVLCNIALGVLPVAFIIETSIFLGKLPAVITAGPGAAAWSPLLPAFVLASAAFIVQQVLTPVREALGVLLARRVDGSVFRQLMATSMRSPGLAGMEDAEVLSHLRRASHELEYPEQSPGKASAGLLALIARYVQLAGCIVIIAVMAWWPIACAVLVAMACLRHAERGGLRRYSMIYAKMQPAVSESFYLRRLAGGAAAAKEIRIFGLLDWLQARYHAAHLRWLMPVWKERRRVYWRSYLLPAVGSLLASASALAVLGVWAGRHSMALAALAMTLQAAIAALRLGDFYPEADVPTQLGMIGYDAVRDFERSIDRFRYREPDAGRQATGEQVPGPHAAIHFHDVTFTYPGESQPVLDGLELKIPAGRSVAIVGANGAGKTTLVKLLTRMYEPASGVVLADGVDIRAMPVEAWRKRVAVVFQDFLRYQVPARDNIAFGAVDHLDDLEGVREAARKAGIAAAIDRLPAGFDTPLTRFLDGGVELSGGQWQRVALARAFFAVRHGARVLVLDEPTASLDVRAEARFFTELMALTGDVTTIIISHRFSTVRNADIIVTLDKGRVIEQGTHQELLRRGGRYAEMFRVQAERFTDSAGHHRGTADSTWECEAV